MVRITEELVRKKSEHNEGIINSLEELSLHQEDVEKIEHLNNWCKGIQILLLQSNLIPKIENLNKLKKLEYLNLAINNIEKIENLERCETLEKLDLTLNFIGDIESVCSLRNNIHLRHLYLTGNPCTDYEGYREYVIAKLPQLETLDNKEITRSERIKALQKLPQIERKVLEAQRKYQNFRAQQRERLRNANDDLNDDEFWKSPSENAPETRTEMSQRTRKIRKKDERDEKKEKPKKQVALYTKDGRPLNVNEAKVQFTFNEEDPEKLVLDVAVYKYLDTNLLDVDLQPNLVKITIKGKVFQFVLPEEILTDSSTAKRSQVTGHLLITMPRVKCKKIVTKIHSYNQSKEKDEKVTKDVKKVELLEVKESDDLMDFSRIVEGTVKKFVDNPEVPPLEYC